MIRLVNQRGTPAGFLSVQIITGRKVPDAMLSAPQSPQTARQDYLIFVSLSGSATTDNPAARYSCSGMLFYSVPYGALTISTLRQSFRYRITQALRYKPVILSGDSAQAAPGGLCHLP